MSRRPLSRLAEVVVGELCFAALSIGLVMLGSLMAPAPAVADAESAWAALVKGGHVALVRHGNAPPGYGGDPPGFKIEDCATQRNLDELGREQARALGEAFRKRGVRVDRMISSPWCRCLETARLMGFGPPESSWSLVPDRPGADLARLRELKAMIAAWRGPGTLVLATHALTVRPLTGFLPAQAETVVLGPGSGAGADPILVGRIPSPR